MDIVAYQSRDHVHDVMPVIAEASEPLNRLPRLGWVVSQQLIRDHLMHHYVQPWVERLAARDHLLFTPEGIFELGMLRLDQESEFVLVRGIQQFEIESLVGAVPGGHHPRSSVCGVRRVEPAVRRLPARQRGVIVGGQLRADRSAGACWPTSARLPAPAGRTPPAFRTPQTII